MSLITDKVKSRAALYGEYLARDVVAVRRVLKHSVGISSEVLRLNSNLRMKLRTNDRLGHRIARENTFEPHVREALRNATKPGDCVMDIGANVGYYTLLLARITGATGRVISVEPQESVARELRQNVEINKLTNVTVVEKALGSRPGEAVLYQAEAGSESMAALRNNGRFESRSQKSVEVWTLPMLLEHCACERVSVIKIDAEGAELDIFRGALPILTGPARPKLVFEAVEANCRPFGHTVADLICFMRDIGYNLRQLDAEDWYAE